MKKAISLVILGVMLVLMLGVVSATPVTSTTTIIAGKIYNSDYTAVISGADVTVTCGGHDGHELDATSLADGSYKVQYTDECTIDDTLTVYAEKGDLSGTKTGTIKGEGTCDSTENCLINIYSGLDVAVVNVPLVPEFGTIVGVLTALGALGVFFVVRRK